MDSEKVAVYHDPKAIYPADPPFNPDEQFPEYPFGGGNVSSKRNSSYRAVRETLRILGMDMDSYGTSDWNPFGYLLRPGGTVVIKPNMVRDWHETRPELDYLLTTHGSVIRAVIDYCVIALGNRGKIIIADSSENDANFHRILQLQHIGEILDFYALHTDIEMEVRDLRPERVDKIDGLIVGRHTLPGDPEGYSLVNLGKISAFESLDSRTMSLIYGAETSDEKIHEWHAPGKHVYHVCRTFLNADLVIDLPKLKTHRKSGITVSLKSFIGLLGDKTVVPHFRKGMPSTGGDQFRESGMKELVETGITGTFHKIFRRLGPARRYLAGAGRAVGDFVFGNTLEERIRSGNWYGNDTIWRTVIDTARIVSDRNFFYLVDGIIGGEKDGPLGPDPKHAGIVIAGRNPAAVDAATALVIGFDPLKIPIIRESFPPSRHAFSLLPMERTEILSNEPGWNGPFSSFSGPTLDFEPYRGWKGKIESAERKKNSDIRQPSSTY